MYSAASRHAQADGSTKVEEEGCETRNKADQRGSSARPDRCRSIGRVCGRSLRARVLSRPHGQGRRAPIAGESCCMATLGSSSANMAVPCIPLRAAAHSVGHFVAGNTVADRQPSVGLGLETFDDKTVRPRGLRSCAGRSACAGDRSLPYAASAWRGGQPALGVV